MAHSLWIVPLVLLIAYLSSPRFRGDIAQTRIRRLLATGLEKSRYTVFNDIDLPSGGGTTHIDHLVVSRFGIFVIASQFVRGWVSGGEFQDRWKLYRGNRFTRIDNPLHRNALQGDAVANLLKVSPRTIHLLVVLVGQKGLRSAMPERLLSPEKLLPYMRRKARQVMEGEEADRVLAHIEASRIQTSGGRRMNGWRWLQMALLLVLLAGVWFAFGDQLSALKESVGEQRKMDSAPGLFRPDGTPKTEQEIWEDSLVCAYSKDTGRCACVEPGGSKADLPPEKCRSLAERGSILKQ
ncbi:nuclease-related domain-containing protein [Pseudomonadota bacterium]